MFEIYTFPSSHPPVTLSRQGPGQNSSGAGYGAARAKQGPRPRPALPAGLGGAGDSRTCPDRAVSAAGER